MIRAYDEIVDLIASGSGPAVIAAYHASPATREIVASLIEREKAGTLTADETSELDYYMRLEHVMRLAKARALARLSHE
jgi:hypothetical protein